MARPANVGWPVWIGVVSDDLTTQASFYRDTLGLRQIESGEEWIWFDGGNGRLFELLQRSDEPQYDARRYQVGFAVDDIEAASAVLVDGGAERISDLEGGPDSGGRWCYFRDPEGNVFELKESPPGTHE